MAAFASVDYRLHSPGQCILPRFKGILERDVIVWLQAPGHMFQPSDGAPYRIVILATPTEAAHAALLERDAPNNAHLERSMGSLLVEWFPGTDGKLPPVVRAALAKLRHPGP